MKGGKKRAPKIGRFPDWTVTIRLGFVVIAVALGVASPPGIGQILSVVLILTGAVVIAGHVIRRMVEIVTGHVQIYS